MLNRLIIACCLSLFSLLGSGLSSQTANAPQGIKDYWSSCPDFNSEQKDLVLEVLDKLPELKMPHRIYGDLSLLYASEDALSLRTSKLGVWTLRILPQPKGGQVLAVITTVEAPTVDSQIQFYRPNWEPLPRTQFISLPTAKDFVRNSNQAEVLLPLISPLYTHLSFDGELLDIQLSSPIILDDHRRKQLGGELEGLPHLLYRWDKGKGRFLSVKSR